MRISVNKAVFMDHVDNEIGELFPDCFCVYFELFHLLNFINVKSMNELHYKKFFGWNHSDLWYVQILYFLFLNELFHFSNVVGLLLKIQFFVNILIELFDQPRILEVLEEILSHLHEALHQV